MVNTLGRLERMVGEQELAQHDGPRHTDAFVGKIELLNAVLAQGGERDVAEDGESGMLQHNIGQSLGSITSDVVEADIAETRKRHDIIGHVSRGVQWRQRALTLAAGLSGGILDASDGGVDLEPL